MVSVPRVTLTVLVDGAGFKLTRGAARRGWVEELVMRFSDFAFAFPALLSAIMLTAIYGPGLVTSIVALSICVGIALLPWLPGFSLLLLK